MREIKVFVSSPGDAQFERMRLERVVERLNGELNGAAILRTIRWETSFYQAHKTFQAQIPEATQCDIVIGILRHRLGTELPPGFPRMPNGEPYPSGTAYEVLTAIEARRTNEIPDIYVFRSTEPPIVRLDEPSAREVVERQWERLKRFFEIWFVSSDGQFKAAFQTFSSTDDFETQVERLLRHWIGDHVLREGSVSWPIATMGSPFRGLDAFGARHARVFYGRSRDISRAVDTFKDAARGGTPFLLVVGPSGAGKSSLARAGLVPRLTAPGVVPEVDIWRVAAMRPAERGADLFQALAENLLMTADLLEPGEKGRPPALPEIAESGYSTPRDLGALLAHADAASIKPILHALDGVGRTERAASGYERPVATALLLLVDQLDELFAADIAEDTRNRFAALLAELVGCGRVWVIATLRSDLYERYGAVPQLLALKRAGASYDLAPPGPAELAEIVRLPADAAKLVYEADASGRTLDERLLSDADRADMLPLLQFTLNRLFEQRVETDGQMRLTRSAYEAIGGLAGAVDKEAERAIGLLGSDEVARLPRLLRQLATPSVGADGARDAAALTVRAVPLPIAAHDEPAARLVEALVGARILLASGDKQEATIRLAHQRVLESWTRARQIIAESRDFIRIRDDVENLRQRGIGLIPRGVLLAEAESIAKGFRDELAPETASYIARSASHVRRRQQITAAAAIVFFGLAVAAGYLGWLSNERAVAEQAAREESQRNFETAKATVDGIIGAIAEGLRGTSGIATEKLHTILSDLGSMVNRLTDSAPDDIGLQQSKFAMLLEFGDTYRAAGESDLALEAYGEALAIANSLAAPAPENFDYRRDVARALEKLGIAQLRVGDTDAALAALDDSLEMGRTLANERPDNDIWHHVAIVLNDIGDAKRRAGDYPGALDAYAEGLDITRRLTVAAPDNAEWRQELASSLIHIGDVRAILGDMQGGMAAHTEALDTYRKISAAQPDNPLRQRDVSISLISLADLQLGEGETESAQEAYEEAYDIRRHLVMVDPGNQGWRSELATSLERLADVRYRSEDASGALSSYREAVGVRRRLAESDPENAEWQYDLARGLQSVGDASGRTDDTAGAASAYQEAADILRRITQAAPGNTRWDRRLAIVLNRLGDQLFASGDSAAGLAAHEEGLAIRRKLVEAVPENAGWKNELLSILDRVAELAGESRRTELVEEAEALRSSMSATP